MFVTLVAVLCHVLPGGSGGCVEEIVTNSNLSSITFQSCTIQGQIGIVKWMSEHPIYHANGARQTYQLRTKANSGRRSVGVRRKRVGIEVLRKLVTRPPINSNAARADNAVRRRDRARITRREGLRFRPCLFASATAPLSGWRVGLLQLLGRRG